MGCPGVRGVLFFAPHAISDGYIVSGEKPSKRRDTPSSPRRPRGYPDPAK